MKDNTPLLPPPPDPTYTQIPHQLIRNLSFFTPPEVMVLLVAYDLTVGYHRTDPQPMSYRWVAEQTGLAKSTVENAIQSLIAKSWILESKKRGKRGVKLYKPVTRPPQTRYEQHNANATVPNAGTVSVPNAGTVLSRETGRHKEKKESNSKKPPIVPPDDIDAIFDQPVFTDDSRHALRVWRELANGPSSWLTDKGRAEILHEAIERLGLQQVCDALRFASKDQYQRGRLGNMHAVKDNIGLWVKMAAAAESNASQAFAREGSNRPELQPFIFEDNDAATLHLDDGGLE